MAFYVLRLPIALRLALTAMSLAGLTGSLMPFETAAAQAAVKLGDP